MWKPENGKRGSLKLARAGSSSISTTGSFFLLYLCHTFLQSQPKKICLVSRLCYQKILDFLQLADYPMGEINEYDINTVNNGNEVNTNKILLYGIICLRVWLTLSLMVTLNVTHSFSDSGFVQNQQPGCKCDGLQP